MTTAQAHIADTLDRAQRCWERIVDHRLLDSQRREATNLFLYHVTTAVLLENIRRLDPALADRLTGWMLRDEGIFEDGYAGELLYEWRQQLAVGQPMHPIGPSVEDSALRDDSIISQSPTRRVGDRIFVSVPGPVPVVNVQKGRRRG